MKIILLRHEERDSDPSFNVHLNNNGMNNREKIIQSLKDKNIKIDMIISSPFIRCLDTVVPICNTYDINICIDYALSEFFDNTYNGCKIPRNYTEQEKAIYSLELLYKPSLEIDNFNEHYTWKSLQKRLKLFIDSIKNKYSDKNILIVTHMTIVNALLNLNNIPRDAEDYFPMGKMTLIDNLDIF